MSFSKLEAASVFYTVYVPASCTLYSSSTLIQTKQSIYSSANFTDADFVLLCAECERSKFSSIFWSLCMKTA